jgi:hypothetical protein
MTGKVKEGLAALCVAAALGLAALVADGVSQDVLRGAAVLCGVLALVAIAVALVRD